MFHTEIIDRWKELSNMEQMANIGAEVGRSINWKIKNEKIARNAFYRALELIDLTLADKKNCSGYKEICRLREVYIDYYVGKNIYKSRAEDWDKYFMPFTIAARKQMGGHRHKYGW